MEVEAVDGQLEEAEANEKLTTVPSLMTTVTACIQSLEARRFDAARFHGVKD